jgi:pimeloyl-ACP methyl ester carboxylesterase
MRFLMGLMLTLLASALSAKELREVSFAASDGARVFANLYGEGEHGVVLAHGMVFNKESWHDQARRIAAEGMRVLAIDFRGYGKSKAGSRGQALELDVLAAMDYLRQQGAQRISVIGGSMGGAAAAKAAALAPSGALEALILLAPAGVDQPGNLQGRKLFLVSSGDSFHDGVAEAHERASEPKRLVVLAGAAHAQHLFNSPQAELVMTEILRWLQP